MKVMAMTIGELDYDNVFHQKEGEMEITFPAVSFLLWIVFIVSMPLLLNNYLVRQVLASRYEFYKVTFVVFLLC